MKEETNTYKLSESLEPYRKYIVGNGDRIENTMKNQTTLFINAPLAVIQACIFAQESILIRLQREGIIP